MARGKLFSIKGYSPWLMSDTSTQVLGSIRSFVFPIICLGITGNPIQAGFVGATGVLAEAIFDFIGGHRADKRDRIKIMLHASIFGVFVSIVLLIFNHYENQGSFIALLVFNALLGARCGYSSSASTAALVNIVPESHIGSALSANQARDASVTLLGAPLAGTLLGFGYGIVYSFFLILETIALVFNFIIIKILKIETLPSDSQGQEHISEKGIGAGFSWICSTKGIALTLAGSSLVSFIVSTYSVSIIYTLQMNGEYYQKIGIFSASIGCGMLLGSVLANYMVAKLRVKFILLSIFFLMSSQIFFNILCGQYYVYLITSFLIFLLVPAVNVILMSYILIKVPNTLLGRVNSAASLINLGVVALPPLFVGYMLAYSNHRAVMIACLALTFLAFTLIFANRQLAKMPQQEKWADYLEGAN